jgi:hypothetical protein
MSCLNKNSLQMISVANMNCYNNKRTRLINMKNNKWKRPCDYIYAGMPMDALSLNIRTNGQTLFQSLTAFITLFE